MEATIENRVADILRRMESYHTDDQTEKELRALSNELLEVRRAMDKIDDKLRKGYWYYNQFYTCWAAKRENARQEHIDAWNASRQLDIFNP